MAHEYSPCRDTVIEPSTDAEKVELLRTCLAESNKLLRCLFLIRDTQRGARVQVENNDTALKLTRLPAKRRSLI